MKEPVEKENRKKRCMDAPEREVQASSSEQRILMSVKGNRGMQWRHVRKGASHNRSVRKQKERRKLIDVPINAFVKVPVRKFKEQWYPRSFCFQDLIALCIAAERLAQIVNAINFSQYQFA